MNRSVLESRQAMCLQKAKLILDTAEREQRALTEAEEKVHASLLAELEAIGQRLERHDDDASMSAAIDRVTGGRATTGGNGHGAGGVPRASGLSWGEQVVRHEAFAQFLKAGGHRTTGTWTSPSVELQGATITEDPASGGGLVLPDVQPGIVPVYVGPIVVANLFAPGQTDSNAVSYMKETAYTVAAAPVAETATKPESAITFAAVTEPVRKLAHWIPASEEILEDVAQMRSYINARLRVGLELVEDDQLLNGTGVAPELSGVLTRPGLAPPVARVDPVTNADAVLDQIMALWIATGVMPSGVVMHPTNWGLDSQEQDHQRRLLRPRTIRTADAGDAVGAAGGDHAGHRRDHGARRRLPHLGATVPPRRRARRSIQRACRFFHHQQSGHQGRGAACPSHLP
jgi:HK97 family phage major capsid protein